MFRGDRSASDNGYWKPPGCACRGQGLFTWNHMLSAPDVTVQAFFQVPCPLDELRIGHFLSFVSFCMCLYYNNNTSTINRPLFFYRDPWVDFRWRFIESWPLPGAKSIGLQIGALDDKSIGL